MPAQPSCPKCTGRMQDGFVIDNTHGSRLVSSWLQGAPEKNFWVGVRLRDKKPVDIATYRCASCGFLESYAKP